MKFHWSAHDGPVQKYSLVRVILDNKQPWWRHQIETFSALLALCVGNSPLTGEFPSQRPLTRSFDVFVDMRLIKCLSKQSWGWWFETASCSLWRHCNDEKPLLKPVIIQCNGAYWYGLWVTLQWRHSGHDGNASQIAGVSSVRSTVCSAADQRKHQSSAPLAFVRGIHQWMDSPHYDRWRHQMETFSAWRSICAGNSPIIGEFPAQRPVTRSFDVFFDLRLNKRLSKQSWGWWFETLLRPLWRHCNAKDQ